MSQFDKQRTGSGTKEWAEHSVNICRGCSHDCLYCYARANALRFKQIRDRSEWPIEVINQDAVEKRYGKKDGVIMFPTTHDITPNTLNASIVVIDKMLRAGNKILIVSKPHLLCITAICDLFKKYTEDLMFRFTIGSLRPTVVEEWESGSPSPMERMKCLDYAADLGFQTSVSMEPMLEGADATYSYFHLMKSFVTEKIWIGKMNKIDRRIAVSSEDIKGLIEKVKFEQRDSEIIRLYETLKDHPKVAWKDSIKQVVENASLS